jgi:exopolyphosphatase/guanosine-5'-triphosphate,3'-diphosphate pyrophosphatase
MVLVSMDIGSNSIRLLVGESRGGAVFPLRYERAPTRLARGLEKTGLLGREAMDNTLVVLKDFLRIVKEYGDCRLRAVGTSALREAKNAGDFLSRLKEMTGIDVKTVSGQEEAELTAMGVLSASHDISTSLIVDIGGGSTELIFCSLKDTIARETLRAGVVKLLEKHIRSDPPSADDMRSLDAECEDVANDARDRFQNHIRGDTVLIGTAGTATTLAGMDLGLEIYDRKKVHMHKIPLERLRTISENLISLPLKERALTKGLEPARADLIIAGIRLTIKFMERMGFSDILISDHGLLEGVLLSIAEEVPE